jgi:hypothetical protein
MLLVPLGLFWEINPLVAICGVAHRVKKDRWKNSLLNDKSRAVSAQ